MALEQAPPPAVVPDPPSVPVPYSELTLNQAAAAAADGDTYYVETMPILLATYPGISYADYWTLTVHEHAALVEAANG